MYLFISRVTGRILRYFYLAAPPSAPPTPHQASWPRMHVAGLLGSTFGSSERPLIGGVGSCRVEAQARMRVQGVADPSRHRRPPRPAAPPAFPAGGDRPWGASHHRRIRVCCFFFVSFFCCLSFLFMFGLPVCYLNRAHWRLPPFSCQGGAVGG